MATRSIIAQKDTESSGGYIYCHWDGYLTGVGKMLFYHYDTVEKVQELMKLGFLSSIEKKLTAPEGVLHTFDDPQPEICVPYSLRGDNLPMLRYSSVNELIENASGSWAEYIYLFDSDTSSWSYTYGDFRDFQPLTKELVTEE